jgi:ribonuclease E
MAVVIDGSEDTSQLALAEQPGRRRVRRKVSAAATAVPAPEVGSDVEPDEIEPVGDAAILDVMPADMTAEPEPAPETQVAAVVETSPMPQPEIDVAALIADDPNQIVAPPEKPKRGWWRR